MRNENGLSPSLKEGLYWGFRETKLVQKLGLIVHSPKCQAGG